MDINGKKISKQKCPNGPQCQLLSQTLTKNHYHCPRPLAPLNQPPPNKPPDIFTFPPNDSTDDFHSFPFRTYPEDFLKKQGPFIKEAVHQLKQETANRLCKPL